MVIGQWSSVSGQWSVVIGPGALAPKGPNMTAQGNALGSVREKTQALKGRNKHRIHERSRRFFRPFRAFGSSSVLSPRALPWADVWCPFGAKDSAHNQFLVQVAPRANGHVGRCTLLLDIIATIEHQRTHGQGSHGDIRERRAETWSRSR